MLKKIFVTCLLLLHIMVFGCKRESPYEDADNFEVTLASDGETLKITEYLLHEMDKNVINIPPSIKGVPVTEIGYGALADRYFTHVTLPDTVVNIMDYALSGNFIREVTIPDSVTEIGNGAFQDNHLVDIIIPDSVRRIGYNAFCWNPVRSVTIGENVQLDSIGGYDTDLEQEWRYIAFLNHYDVEFDDFYEAIGKKAGTYTYGNGNWDFVPRQE